MKTVSYTELRANLASMMDEVNDSRAPLIVTRGRGPAVVMISLEEFAAYEETFHLLSSPANAARLRKAVGDLEAGKGVAHDLPE